MKYPRHNWLTAYMRRFFSYHFTKVSDVNDISDIYTLVAELAVVDLPPGLYENKVTATWLLSVTNKSTYIRWRNNDGPWTEHIKEPKDNTDLVPYTYFYPKLWNGGPVHIQVEMRKEDAVGTLDLKYLDIILDRKGDS